jgi:hypothetical protein
MAALLPLFQLRNTALLSKKNQFKTMTPPKKIWFTMAALLWLWAALAAGLHFTEIPSLFNLSPTAAETAFHYWGTYEIFIFIALALFVVFTRPGSRIWITAAAIGLLVVVKVIWLEPLLYFRAQTVWNGMRPFNVIPLLYVFSEITKIGLLLYTSYWIYRTWAPPNERKSGTKPFLSDGNTTSKQVHHPT